ncbi:MULTISPECIES: ATP-binding protein [unclassified Frankia]|uniref:ATP-binding protein n=1 Tax=unclassified Frankia TaxID=2632575 RepID=UPI001EF74835|nr:MULTISPECIES: ATP-binding protein [unclassified Frankia]
MITSLRFWLPRRSLRTKLTIMATVAIAIGMAMASVLLVVQLRASLVAGLDATARQRAHDIGTGVENGSVATLLSAQSEGDIAVQVVDFSGHLIASSVNLEGEPLLLTLPTPAPGALPARTVHGLPLGDNGAFRVVTARAGTATVYVGVPLGPVDRGVSQLTGELAVGIPVVVALLGMVTWLLAGRALRPVERLRQQAADITATGLQRRLDVPRSQDELARLASTLNDMLARLESSAQRQKDFVADAAHELRSPLSAILAQLEVAARYPDGADWTVTLPDLTDDAQRLSHLVDDLVWLARLDARPRLRREQVDLDEVVFREVRRLRQPRGVEVDQRGVSAARVIADGEALSRVVRNLLDNALRHATTCIEVSVVEANGVARLVVADDGAGVPEAHRQRIFDRFARLDDARDRDAGGCGLGLAIVRDVTVASGGRVHIEDNQPGARFVVEMPAGPLPAGRPRQ